MPSPPLGIADSLRQRRIFLTGATGFVGRVLVEKLLWSVPDVGKLLLLIRADGERSAADRLRDDVLGAELMDRLRAWHGDGWEDFAASRVEAVPGDIGKDRFGLDPGAYAALCRSIDMVVACAATVTFDERLDRALELNTRGAGRTLALARDAGDVPLLHVSTCFVSGRREGTVPERVLPLATLAPGQGELDLGTALTALEARCRRIGAEHAEAEGPLVEAGAEEARRQGFHDVYTLTKALGELLLVRDRGVVPVTIVRPAIVESAAEQPMAGWIDAIRVADPLLVAYGRGRVRALPGAAGAVLDVVPVDHVVHAILAAMAELARHRDAGTAPLGCPVYQVGSSRHPISLGELMGYAREGFAQTPLRDERGEPIRVEPLRFIEPERLRRRLEARRARVRALSRSLGRLPGWRSTRLGSRLGSAERTLDHFLHLIEVYGPYLDHRARHDDAATRGLWSRLSAEDQADFPFDITALDWRSYIADAHVPGLQRFALHAETGAPSPPRPDDALARRHAEGRFASDGASTLFDLFATAARLDPGPWPSRSAAAAAGCATPMERRLPAPPTSPVAWRASTASGAATASCCGGAAAPSGC